VALRKPVDYVVQYIGPMASHRWRSLVRYLNSWINLPLTTDSPFIPDGSKNVSGNLGTVIYDAYTDPENPKYDREIALDIDATDAWAPDESDAEAPTVDRDTEAQQWPTSVQVNDGGVYTDETANERTGMVKGPATIGGYGTASGNTSQSSGLACDSVNWLAQSFYPVRAGYIWRLSLQLYRVGLPGTTATISIQECDPVNDHPNGVDLCYATYAVNSLSTTPGSVITLTMDNWLHGHPWWFDSAKHYAVVVRTTGIGGTFDMGWRYSTTGGVGELLQSSDSGATWVCPNSAYRFYMQYYMNDNDTGYYNVYGVYWEAQTFTAAATGHIRRIVVKGYVDIQNDPLDIIAHIRATAAGLPTGVDLAVQTLDWSARATLDNYISRKLWTNSFIAGRLTSYLEIDFDSPSACVAGTLYALILSCTAATAIGWRWVYAAAFASGNRCQSTNGGSSWSTKTEDFLMEIWYTVTDVDLLPAAIAADDYIAFGSDSPFEEIMQDISVVGAGTYVVAWEYSQGGGAWAACVGLTDNSNGFRNQWNQTIQHTPQGDWALETINGVQAYYLRCRITDAGAGYSQPQGTYCLLKRTLN